MSIRTLGAGIVALGLLATPVLAQTPQPANNGVNNSATNNSSTSSSSMGSSLMGDRIELTHGGLLSSKLVGADVYNDQNQSIGSIDNLIVGTDGQISSAVISVGGFLGVGSKLVDVPFSRLQFKQDGNGNGRKVLLPNATQASLKSMESFSYSS